MKAAFPQGQGRHVVEQRRAMGDLGAQVLQLLGADDATFGSTGTPGEAADTVGVARLETGSGFDGYVNADTPLHTGELDL